MLRIVSTQPNSIVIRADIHPLPAPGDGFYTGGSYALVGSLATWLVWLLLRWRSVPGTTMRQRRNKQVLLIVAAMTTVICYNFLKYNVVATTSSLALLGTFLHGCVLAALCLRFELPSPNAQTQLRIGATAGLFAIYVGLALVIMPN